jgi:hypothetical protein
MPPDTPPAPTPPAPTAQPPAPAPPPAAPPAPIDDDDDEYSGLNAAGRRAVAELHATRKQLRTDLRTARAQIAQFEQERAQLKGSQDAVGNLKRGLLENAVAAAAAGRLADPQDAMRLVDISDITVGDDGKVDSAKLKERIDKLLTDKPYLAASPGGRSGSGAPSGARPPGLPGGGQRPAPQGGGINEMIREAARR